MSQANHKAVAS